jgi:hypothetical protein
MSNPLKRKRHGPIQSYSGFEVGTKDEPITVVDGEGVFQDARIKRATPTTGDMAAKGTLTFIGGVSDAETVTIGDDVYEFDTDNTVTAGYIKVNVADSQTAGAAITALVAAITANDDSLVTAVDGDGDTVVVTAKIKGLDGNGIDVDTTCSAASWGATNLMDGANAATTGYGMPGEIRFDPDYLYVCVAPNDWKRIALTDF